MSRCFKHYDVKHLRQGGCVPATREAIEGEILYLLLRNKYRENQR
jgi:hypothetical protein